jgi:hypothetical protein
VSTGPGAVFSAARVAMRVAAGGEEITRAHQGDDWLES